MAFSHGSLTRPLVATRLMPEIILCQTHPRQQELSMCPHVYIYIPPPSTNPFNQTHIKSFYSLSFWHGYNYAECGDH